MSDKDLNAASEQLDRTLLNAVTAMNHTGDYNAAILREVRQRLKDNNIGVAPTGDTDLEELAEAYDQSAHALKLPDVDTTEADAATG